MNLNGKNMLKKILHIMMFIFLANYVFCAEKQENNSQAINLFEDKEIAQDTVLEGEIYVKGILTILSGITVTIKPGTVIKFIKVDTNNDDIGESGIYVQGTLIAQGEKENLITFTSAESVPFRGDWDNIFFISSEGSKNLLEYCKLEYSYHGIHSHFSMVKIKNVTLLNNYRAMQFQESIIRAEGNILENNQSGIRFRDSEVFINNNIFRNNFFALNFYRSEVEIKNNILEKNLLQSINSRESNGVIEDNKIWYNRQGIYTKDSHLIITKNIINNNYENGISLSFCSTSIISNNTIEWNGGHGIAIDNSDAKIRNNNLIFNGKYNLYILGNKNINAESNYWGSIDTTCIKAAIFDYNYDSTLGIVQFIPFLESQIEADALNDKKSNE